MITLADDSGLEVMALGGRPGVLSARYAGPDASFEAKMARLLAELDETGNKDRTARFAAAIALADGTGRIIHTATAICPGHIASEPRGSSGFGYDPLFIPDGYEQTFAELPEEIKREISHRGRSFRKIIPFLRGFFAV
jgi:XTP/dITP diphosphohydrolase